MPLTDERVKQIFTEKSAEVSQMSFEEVCEHIRFLSEAAHVIQVQTAAVHARRAKLIDGMDEKKVQELRQYRVKDIIGTSDTAEIEKSKEKKVKGRMNAAVQSIMKLFGMTEEQATEYVRKGQK